MDLPSNQSSLFGSGVAGDSPFTPGGSNPFVVGLQSFGSTVFDDIKKQHDIGQAPSSGVLDKINNLLSGDYLTRFGLEIIGGIFIVFGFFMLAMRGGGAIANSEAGRAVASVIK